ncbi:MAG: DUF3868 domain-containing protein [Dysgonamonadaceae bacterium]|jgi:tetratricopeptide (TPR) repeat protein|nr:DUF3868 domain-containing protein [Dysgonamonadaceae bacterium]
MKRKYFLTASATVLLFSIALSGYSQSALKNRFDMKVNRIRKIQDNLQIDASILLHGTEVSGNNRLTVTPVIRAANGLNVKLMPVIVNGKHNHNLFMRSLRLQDKQGYSKVHSIYKTNIRYLALSVPYETQVVYAPWMRDASLYLIAELCGCGGSDKDYQEKLILEHMGEGSAIEYTPQVNFVAPAREAVKQRSETGVAYLIFEQSQWQVLPDLLNNREELAKIDRSLNYIKEELASRITGISIKAYASPEGPFNDNLRLSKNRAKALLDYIRNRYDLPEKLTVFSEGYGEDWDGLAGLIQKDPKVENADQILRLIRTVDIFQGREKQIMDLNGGRPYLYMLKHLFPLLRRSEYQIEYAVPEVPVEQGIGLVETKPVMLSLDEMYRIANTYEKGSEAFNKVFKIAGNTYPDNPTAAVNAAAVAILEKDYATAKQYIEKYAGEPSAWNNLGIVYMSELRLDEAERYLLKAQSAGTKEADYNLEILQALQESRLREN